MMQWNLNSRRLQGRAGVVTEPRQLHRDVRAALDDLPDGIVVKRARGDDEQMPNGVEVGMTMVLHQA